MRVRPQATLCPWRAIVVIILGEMVLLTGCQPFVNRVESLKSPTTNAVPLCETDQAGSEETCSTELLDRPQTAATVAVETVDVTITSEQMVLSTQHITAGNTQFLVRNSSTETVDILVLQSDLSPESIPIKDNRVDFSTGSVTLVAQLDNSPLPIFGSDTIFSTLEPGNYVIMVYPSGKITRAMKQVITVQATSEI